jgi:hypothetical protein
MVYSHHDSSKGITHLFLLAISGEPPIVGQNALALPELDRRRAGLLHWKEAWITISEANYDIFEKSYYLDTNQSILGSVSPSFLRRVAVAFREALKRGARRVDRAT